MAIVSEPQDNIILPPCPWNNRRYVWKNIICISLAFMLNYTSYSGLAALQSSLHIQEGMGVICTSIRYISLVISSLLVPDFLIGAIGHKWTLTVSLMAFSLWMAANGYGIWETMIPASVLNGVFVAPLWAAQGSYFTKLSRLYSSKTKENHEVVIARFFGIFYMFYLASIIFGSVISTTVLKDVPPENYTKLTDEQSEQICGLRDCPYNIMNNTNLLKPSSSTVWTLVGIYITLAVCAVLIVVFAVNDLPKTEILENDKHLKKTLFNKLTATFSLMKNKEIWLLVPLSVYTGVDEIFFLIEFNRSWVTCALGIWMIGLVSLPYGFTSALSSLFSGELVKRIGRLPLMCTAFLLGLGVHLTLALSQVTVNYNWWYYAITFSCGLYYATILTTVSSLYGIMFPNRSEAAYASFMFWQCIGYSVSSGYSYFLCAKVKFYVMVSLFCFSMVCYIPLEILHKIKARNVNNKNRRNTEIVAEEHLVDS